MPADRAASATACAADLLREGVEHHVVGERHRLLQVAVRAARALVVAQAGHRLARERGAEPDRRALLKACEHGERLERGAREPLDPRVVEAEAVLAAVVGQDAAGLGVDRDERAAQVGGLTRERVVDGVDGLPLPGRVDRRGDAQPLLGDVLLGDAEVGQLGDHRRDDVPVGARGHAAALRGAGDGGREALGAALSRGEPALGDHAVEDELPARHGPVRVHGRVPARRRLDHAGEDRALGDRQVLHVLAEVGLARRLDAVGAAAEVDGVEVVAEDLVLGVLLGDLDRDDQFLVLAPQRGRVADEGVLDVLLGDRGAAAVAAADLVPRGPRDADRVEAGVRVEAAVLGGEHGLAHVLRHGLDRHLRAVALLGHEPGERVAVGVGEQRDLVVHHVVRRGDGEDDVPHGEGQHGAEKCTGGEPEQHEADPATPGRRAGSLAFRRAVAGAVNAGPGLRGVPPADAAAVGAAHAGAEEGAGRGSGAVDAVRGGGGGAGRRCGRGCLPTGGGREPTCRGFGEHPAGGRCTGGGLSTSVRPVGGATVRNPPAGDAVGARPVVGAPPGAWSAGVWPVGGATARNPAAGDAVGARPVVGAPPDGGPTPAPGVAGVAGAPGSAA